MCRIVRPTAQALQLSTLKDPHFGLCVPLPVDETQLCQR